MERGRRLPVYAIASSLVANWVASENLTGTTGQVACSHAIPAILLDPIGAALCLVLLGVLLAPFAGRFETMTGIVIDRYGVFVGGVASSLCLVGSLLWAGGQYKAVLELLDGLNVIPQAYVEPIMVFGLLSWTLIGGLVADVWLDLLSIVIIAPCVITTAAFAISWTPPQAFEAEVAHAKQLLPSQTAANMLLVGILGNMFTEELAGRVLLAGSPFHARIACLLSAAMFSIMGLAPAALGIWIGSQPDLLLDEAGTSLCENKQDLILSVALRSLVPSWMHGGQLALSVVLIIESLNTVDTSVLMCAKVFETQVGRLAPNLEGAAWWAHASVTLSLGVVAAVARLGQNVWEMGEAATSAVGAPLGVLCIFLPFDIGGPTAALTGVFFAQVVFMAAKWTAPLVDGEVDGMPFVWGVVSGVFSYVAVAKILSPKSKSE